MKVMYTVCVMISFCGKEKIGDKQYIQLYRGHGVNRLTTDCGIIVAPPTANSLCYLWAETDYKALYLFDYLF